MVNNSSERKRMLRASAWTGGLTPEQRLRLEDESHEKEFDARAVVWHEGAPADHWMGVVDGMVKAESVDADGRSTTFMAVGAGGWLAEGSVIKGEPLRYNVVALLKSRICFVPRATFLRLMMSSLPFNHFVIAQLNARLGHFMALTETQRKRVTVAQVAHCVAELFDPQLNPMPNADVRISQQEIGRLCGFSRQVASRALRLLEQEGLVHVHHGGINVLDVNGLNRFVQVH